VSEAALESDKMLMVSTQLGKTGLSYSICDLWHFTNGLQMEEEIEAGGPVIFPQ
jgi:hypothetical protein